MAKGGGKGAQETFQKLLKCHVATSQIAKILTLSFNVPCGLIERVLKEARDKRAALVACTRKKREREGEGSGESAGAVMARTLTLRRSQGRAGQGEARSKSRSQSGANPIHKSLSSPLSLPQRTAIQRANDSLTRDIFGWQIRWEAEAEPDSVLAITSTITTHGAAGRRSRV